MRAKTFKGGIHPKEYKELSNQCPITAAFPKSKTVTIPVTMGGAPNQPVVKIGDEVAKALSDYIEGDRKSITPIAGHEHALFLSTQRKRIGIRAVENLVKKYAKQVTPLKKITPHKLRSTYGTALYQETGDIYLVADVLGHKDVNTTRKHYASVGDARRRSAAKYVKLRED